jgi:hypothetical protein
MAGKYRSGIKVKEKDSVPTKVQFATAFADQMDRALDTHAASLQQLDSQTAIPKKLHTPIQVFFGIVIHASDQYKPNLKQLTTTHLKKTQALRLAATNFESFTNRTLSKSNAGGTKLIQVLRDLISDVHHFIQQQEMTHHSYTPGMSLNVRPVNWALREDVHAHIIEHQSIFGFGKYPNLNAAQIRAQKNGHQLPPRTYREIKTMHKNGTLFHYAQTRKRQ